MDWSKEEGLNGICCTLYNEVLANTSISYTVIWFLNRKLLHAVTANIFNVDSIENFHRFQNNPNVFSLGWFFWSPAINIRVIINLVWASTCYNRAINNFALSFSNRRIKVLLVSFSSSKNLLWLSFYLVRITCPEVHIDRVPAQFCHTWRAISVF